MRRFKLHRLICSYSVWAEILVKRSSVTTPKVAVFHMGEVPVPAHEVVGHMHPYMTSIGILCVEWKLRYERGLSE